MHNRLWRGDTAENNQLTLSPGALTLDHEKKALRIHNGESLGGLELIGERVVPTGPGPQELMVGDTTVGFYGEVAADEFISREELTTQIGLSAGNMVTTREDTWLKFSLDNSVLFVHKTGIVEGMTRSALLTLGIVYPDSGTDIVVNGQIFRVRLLNGINQDPATIRRGQENPPETHGSEWNRLMYPIHETDINGQNWGIDYTNEDIQVGFRDQCNTMIQETHVNFKSANRGYDSVGFFGAPSIDDDPNNLWRPVLELVQ